MIESSRRSFITGLVSFVAAPAIVRVASIMPVKVIEPEIILPLYGRSPAMDALPSLTIENMIEMKRSFLQQWEECAGFYLPRQGRKPWEPA